MLNTLNPFLQEAWEKSGFQQATSIQEAAIPMILEGKDLIAESPTGTGKTLAYLLPLLNKIEPNSQSLASSCSCVITGIGYAGLSGISKVVRRQWN